MLIICWKLIVIRLESLHDSKTEITLTRTCVEELNPSASRIDFRWNLFRSLFIDKIVIEEDE